MNHLPAYEYYAFEYLECTDKTNKTSLSYLNNKHTEEIAKANTSF